MSTSRSSLNYVNNHLHHLHHHHHHHHNHYHYQNGHHKPTHHRTRSDTSGVPSALANKSNSVTSLKQTMGDLMSGRAFDNNCNCFEIQYQQFQLKQQLLQINNGIPSDLKQNEPDTMNIVIDEANKENEIDEHLNARESETDSSNSEKISLNENLNYPVAFKFECTCNAPRLAPELEFSKALITIGKKLIRLGSKELKSKN